MLSSIEQLADLAPPGGSSDYIDQLTPVGKQLFFTVSTVTVTITGNQDLVQEADTLYVTDGKGAGTRALAGDGGNGDEAPQIPATLTGFNNSLCFIFGSNLWRSDGTQKGTYVVFQGAESPPNIVGTADDKLFFAVTGGPKFKPQLWITGGTEKTNQQIGALDAGDNIGAAFGLRSKLLFCVTKKDGTRQLWVSDGTSSGTSLLSTGIGVDRGAVIGSKLVFLSATADGKQEELWVSDGTPSGTQRVASGLPTATVEGDSGGTVLGGKWLFDFRSPSHALELWCTDGTSKGTGLVKEIVPSKNESLYPALTAVQGSNIALFIADSDKHESVWRTDGTSAGTFRIKAISSSSGKFGIDPNAETSGGGRFYFATTAGDIWTSDGSDQGTYPFADRMAEVGQGVAYCNGKVFFVREEADDPLNLDVWRANPQVGSVSGSVFDDQNSNGIRDAGEGGLSGWRVYLDLDGDGHFDPGEPFARTTSSGHFRIDDAPVGRYTLRIGQVSGFVPVGADAARITIRSLHNTTKVFSQAAV